jgi:selenocysteine lyase/cysteine desulfurase
VNYLGLPAVTIGLRSLATIGVELMHDRVMALTGWLLDSLAALRHSTGGPLVRLYGPPSTDRRGGTIAFSLIGPLGRVVDTRAIESRAAATNISLRTGCFCNPGAAESAFGISPEAVATVYGEPAPLPIDELVARLGMEGGGAVRVSFGAVSNFADARSCVRFLRSFIDTVPDERNLPPRTHC